MVTHELPAAGAETCAMLPMASVGQLRNDGLCCILEGHELVKAGGAGKKVPNRGLRKKLGGKSVWVTFGRIPFQDHKGPRPWWSAF
jgi:hypothetical protein